MEPHKTNDRATVKQLQYMNDKDNEEKTGRKFAMICQENQTKE